MRLLTKWPSLAFVFEVSVKRSRDNYLNNDIIAFDYVSKHDS